MPIHVFKCLPCALRFEAFGPPALTSSECPNCHKVVKRDLPSGKGSAASFKSGGSAPTPPNSGAASLDYVADRAIGESAVTGWDEVGKREALKRRVLRNTPGASWKDLAVNPDGTYTPVPTPARVQVEKVREEAIKTYVETKAPESREEFLRKSQ